MKIDQLPYAAVQRQLVSQILTEICDLVREVLPKAAPDYAVIGISRILSQLLIQHTTYICYEQEFRQPMESHKLMSVVLQKVIKSDLMKPETPTSNFLASASSRMRKARRIRDVCIGDLTELLTLGGLSHSISLQKLPLLIKHLESQVEGLLNYIQSARAMPTAREDEFEF